MKIRPVGAELFHADRRTDGQTDMAKPIVAFHNFAKAPKMSRRRDMKKCVTGKVKENHLRREGKGGEEKDEKGALLCVLCPVLNGSQQRHCMKH